MTGAGKGRLWSWLLALPLAGLLLYWSLRGIDWRTVGGTLAQSNWVLVLGASLCTCFSFFLRSLRWRILLNAEAHLSVGDVFRANMVGYLGNSFLPARAGEVVRTLIVSRLSSLTRTYVFTTALSERLMDAIALVLWSSLILLGISSKPVWMAGIARGLAIAAALGAIAIAILPHTGALCEKLLRRVPMPAGLLRDRLLELTAQVLLGMRAFHHVGRFAGFVAFTLAIWLTDAVGFMVGARALGLDMSFTIAMLLLAALGLGSALPSTPGYVGIYQFVAVTVLVPLGIAKSQALAYILMTQAYGYVVIVALGLPCLYVLRSKHQVKLGEQSAA